MRAGPAENSVLNEGGTLDVRAQCCSATGYSKVASGALVATTRATRVTGTRADGVAFSIEQMRRTISCWQMAAC
ncbi:autotransporter adhesin family protein [Escherichia coli]|nr:autotransporter adhesin family protein [Escherichia coli]